MAEQSGYPGTSLFKGMTPFFCQDLCLQTYGPSQGAAALLWLLLASTTMPKCCRKEQPSRYERVKTHSAHHCPKCTMGHHHCTWRHFYIFPHFVPGLSHLTVQTQHHQHGEEEDWPEWGQGQLCDNLWVGEESQSRACSNEKWDELMFTKHLMGSLS